VASVRFDNVTKRFRGAEGAAVDGASFEVPAGSFVVLLGPSGCGKTTLLKTVNRLQEPDSGAVLLDGVDVTRIEATTLRRQIGYVIQHVGLFPHMTVARNVGVVPRLLCWPSERVEARVDELLDLVALPPGEFRARFPSQLSGGQQQRVGLARALAAGPKLLLMDEPFGAIDAITRASLQDEMLRLKKELLRQTVLFVTHDVEEALRLADRVVVMRAGRVVQYDAPLAVLAAPADDFVRELLGADDVLRTLGLLPVSSAMSPVDGAPDTGPALAPDQSLREALSLLLASGASSLAVVDGGTVVGTITLEKLRGAAASQWPVARRGSPATPWPDESGPIRDNGPRITGHGPRQ
jgi:osmoprotectant transport system ATP-binding protein